jgi:hypothetical protein
MGRNAQKRRSNRPRGAGSRPPTSSRPSEPQLAPDQIAIQDGPEHQAWAKFEHGAKFQQMVSEVVSHTEESIDHLEGLDDEHDEWAKPLIEQYKAELKEMRQFYSGVRRYVNEHGRAVCFLLDPRERG